MADRLKAQQVVRSGAVEDAMRSALLARLAGPSGAVTTVELDEAVAASARQGVHPGNCW